MAHHLSETGAPGFHGGAEVVEDLIHQALREDPEDHPYWNHVSALQSLSPERVVAAAVRLYSSACPRERALSVDVVAQVGAPERPLLEERLALLLTALEQDPDPEVLAGAAVGLGHLRDSRGIPALVRRKDHPDARVRYGVAHGLLTHEDPDAVAALIELSRDADAQVRDWATFGLGQMMDLDTPEIRAALTARLDDPDDQTCAEAIEGLSHRSPSHPTPNTQHLTPNT